MMRLFITCLVLVLFALLPTSCDNDASSVSSTDQVTKVDSLFEAYYEYKLTINPLEATYQGLKRDSDKVVNYLSDEVQKVMIYEYSNFLDAIKEIDTENLKESDLLSLKVMEWDCNIKREGLTNPLVTVASPVFDMPNISLMPLNQIFSFHLYFIALADVSSAQPFETIEDYKNWQKRVGHFLSWLETAQSNMEEGIEKGVVMPKVITERMIVQLDQFTNPNIEENAFYGVIKEMPEEFTNEEKEELEQSYREMITERIIPVYEELEEFLREKYLPAGVETAGLGALPNGETTYKYLIKYHTSTTMTPDEIFELGKSEVKRIRGEMEKVKEQVGFQGDLKAFFDHVRTSEEQMPFNDPQEVIDNFYSIHERMKDNLATLFDLTPKSKFEIRRTQAYREASASAEYNAGSKDGSRPGIFYVPIPDVKSYNKFMDEALFLHEAIPGHHYQISLQQENTDLPEFMHAEGMGVYVEGWALYTESLGKELGLYDDPYQYFGMLGMEMHRAIRLVVDVGIHAKGWTREQAIQYSLENEADSEESITAEIERYMVAPGQALSYKIGQLKIRELRTKAEKELGSKFNIKEFHNQILNTGSLPLKLLEDKIDNWIESQLEGE